MFTYLENIKEQIIIWWQSLDKNILFAVFLLFSVGIILIITVSPFIALRINIDAFYFIKNHFIYIILSLITLMIISQIKEKDLFRLCVLGFMVSIFLMILIIFLGAETKGAKRWFYLFGFSMQPSEFVKVFIIMIYGYLYQYLISKKQEILTIYLGCLLLYGITIGLLLLQPDLGMSILITLGLAITFFILGISWTLMLILGILGLGCLIIMYFIFPHVSYRVNSFLLEEKTYQVSKSLEAISSGKIFGKGAGQGEVKQYLPDVHSDFIFSIAAEEFGLIFAMFVIGIFLYIILKVIRYVFLEKEMFKIIVLTGLIATFALQVFIHIASNINLIPTKGMTLPFISYGGSSMLSNSILIGIILNLTRNKGINKEDIL